MRVSGILVENNKILLVRHQGLNGTYNLWSPPGGGLAYGEKILDCLVREFAEETGLRILPGRFLFMREYLNEPLHAIELFFAVKLIGGTLQVGLDPELSAQAQLIQEVAFKSLADLRQDPTTRMHQIFVDLIHLDDLFMPQNQFLK